MRMQAAQVVVSPIAGSLESSQIELIGQRGSSGHTVHLRGKKGSHRLGVRPYEMLIFPLLLSLNELLACMGSLPSPELSYLRVIFPWPKGRREMVQSCGLPTFPSSCGNTFRTIDREASTKEDLRVS